MMYGINPMQFTIALVIFVTHTYLVFTLQTLQLLRTQ